MADGWYGDEQQRAAAVRSPTVVLPVVRPAAPPREESYRGGVYRSRWPRSGYGRLMLVLAVANLAVSSLVLVLLLVVQP